MKPASFPARVFINQQEIMYVMQLHSVYAKCVEVKGNYTPPVCFPQLSFIYYYFSYFPFVQSSTSPWSGLFAQMRLRHEHQCCQRRFRVSGSLASYCSNYSGGLVAVIFFKHVSSSTPEFFFCNLQQ